MFASLVAKEKVRAEPDDLEERLFLTLTGSAISKPLLLNVQMVSVNNSKWVLHEEMRTV